MASRSETPRESSYLPRTTVSVVGLVAAAFVVLPILFGIDFKLSDVWRLNRYRIGLGTNAFFVFLAVIPGFLGFIYHLVTVSDRRRKGLSIIKKFYEVRNEIASRKDRKMVLIEPLEPVTHGPVSALAASALLTGVFLFVAVVYAFNTKAADVTGILFAGLGAYVAVLFAMIGRVYASALSSRFLMASSLGTAAAITMGWAIAKFGFASVFNTANASATTGTAFVAEAALFLVGISHKLAYDALRARARKLFGATEPEAAEIEIAVVEGIDDTSADLLNEYGVTSIQHLATAEPGELCERTLLPLQRVLDWIDQALLIARIKRSIGGARSLGIRGAVDLVLIWIDAAGVPASEKGKLLASLAEKCSMPIGAINDIAEQLSQDFLVGLIYELEHGVPLPSKPEGKDLVPDVVAAISQNYNIAKLDSTDPIGRLLVKSA
jgi:hypothetical protein